MFVIYTKDQYKLFVGHIDAYIIDAIPMVTFKDNGHVFIHRLGEYRSNIWRRRRKTSVCILPENDDDNKKYHDKLVS